MRVLSIKVPIQKKYGNLFNDPCNPQILLVQIKVYMICKRVD